MARRCLTWSPRSVAVEAEGVNREFGPYRLQDFVLATLSPDPSWDTL